MCNLYAFWLVSDDLKTCPYVEFCSIFWPQALLKIFLCLKSIHIRYPKGPPRSGIYICNNIMVVQHINQFLLKEMFIHPPKYQIWKSLPSVLFLFFILLRKIKVSKYPLKIQKSPPKSTLAVGMKIHTNYQILNKIITSILLQIQEKR